MGKQTISSKYMHIFSSANIVNSVIIVVLVISNMSTVSSVSAVNNVSVCGVNKVIIKE